MGLVGKRASVDSRLLARRNGIGGRRTHEGYTARLRPPHVLFHSTLASIGEAVMTIGTDRRGTFTKIVATSRTTARV
jgi:hypothetical protein